MTVDKECVEAIRLFSVELRHVSCLLQSTVTVSSQVGQCQSVLAYSAAVVTRTISNVAVFFQRQNLT